MPWAAAAAVGGALISAKGQKDAAKAAAAGSTQTNQLDPRANNILYGNNEDGLLKYFEQFAKAPQSAALQNYGNTSNNYLTNYAGADTDRIRNAGHALLDNAGASPLKVGAYGTNGVAQIGTPQVQAPSQNSLDLSGSFDRFINGDAGANPYLTKSLQAGIDATNAGFAKNQADLTNNLQRNVLPGIRSGAIGAGQYGGSRQAILEANALSDYTNQLTSANTQLGLANSANTTAQQANAFNQGQDRALSATLNLSGQQYGVASQNAELALRAQMANQSEDNAMRRFGASMAQTADQSNAQLQLQQRNQNNAALATGAGLLSGGLGTALSGATGAQNYGLSQAQATAGLLSPFIGLNSTSTSTQPNYGSAAGSAIGGALGGLSLYQQFANGGSGYNAQNIRNTTTL